MTNLAEKPPSANTPKPLSPREEDALRVMREVARADRQRPRPQPIVPRRGNRYIRGA